MLNPQDARDRINIELTLTLAALNKLLIDAEKNNRIIFRKIFDHIPELKL
jgi:hypothetical protein